MTLGLVLLGRQGSGKGTQAALLAAHYGIPHVSTGDMLRAAVAEGSEFGRKAKEYMDAGQLLPDDIMTGIVVERLERPDAARGFLLDGFPRTVPQAEALDDACDRIDLAVNLEVPSEIVLERLVNRRVCTTCGRIYSTSSRPAVDWVCDNDGGAVALRSDDNTDAIRARLEGYEVQTAPLIPWYEGRGMLATVDGVGSTGEVFERLRATIDARLTR